MAGPIVLTDDNFSSEVVESSQPVLVDFWATWCGPCKQELPHLSRILKENKKKGLVVLAISTDSPQTQAQVATMARRWNVKTLLDPDGMVVDQLNPRGVAPYTIFVDRKGRMASDHDGYHVGDEVDFYRKPGCKDACRLVWTSQGPGSRETTRGRPH